MGSRSRTQGARAFQGFAEGIARGLTLLQQQKQHNDRIELERELAKLRAEDQDADRRLRKQQIGLHAEDQRLDRENRQSEFADRMASDQETRDLRRRELEERISDLKGRAEDRDLDRQARLDIAESRKKADKEAGAFAKILGHAPRSEDERLLARKLASHAGPWMSQKMDPDSIVQKFLEPGTSELPMEPALLKRLERINKGRATSGGTPIDVSGKTAKLGRADLLELAGQSELFAPKAHTTAAIEPALKETMPLAGKLGVDRMDLEQYVRNMSMHPEILEELGLGAQPEQPGMQPGAVGGMPGRTVDNRDGNTINARKEGMVGATGPEYAGVLSTNPVERVTSWLSNLHTPGYAAMPPTIDMAVSPVNGVPQLKPDVAAMIEAAFPNQGLVDIANQQLQSLATAQQQMQQTAQRGSLQGPPPGQGQGEQAASRAASRPASRPMAPAQTQQSQPRRDPMDTRGYGSRGR